MKMQTIKPDPNCPECHGTGEVYDWVDYGSTRVSMPSFCSCVENQTDEDAHAIELDLSDLDNAPAWGQDDISEEEHEKRIRDWDKYWI